MILRVITLLRGLLASVNVDVAASALWARTAARVLMDTSQDSEQVSWCALD